MTIPGLIVRGQGVSPNLRSNQLRRGKLGDFYSNWDAID